MRNKTMALTLKQLFVSVLLFISVVACAEKNSSGEVIRKWLAAPDKANISDIFNRINSLDNNEVIRLVREIEGYSFTQQIILMGIVAKYERLDLISRDCLTNASDVEKAVCIAALKEWKGQRGKELSLSEQNIAINMLGSQNISARRLIVLTLLATDYYSPDAFNTTLEIIKMDLSKQPFGDEIKDGYIKILEVITDSDTNNLNDTDKVSYFRKWFKTNKHLLKPSTLVRKNQLNYKNYLHRFALDLPISYRRVFDPKFVKGKRCFFADHHGRSIAVETHPKKGGVKMAFEEVKRNADAVKYKETTIGKYPAIMYKINVKRGNFIGLIVEIEDRTILATGYLPLSSDSFNSVEELLNGLSII